jgi:hypothetical protein
MHPFDERIGFEQHIIPVAGDHRAIIARTDTQGSTGLKPTGELVEKRVFPDIG